MEKEKNVKKITLGGIVSWIVGVFFIFAGLGVLTTGLFLYGIIIIILSIMITPYFNKVAESKLNFKISGGVKVLLVIVILVVAGMAMSKETSTNKDVTVQPSETAQEKTTPAQTETKEAETQPEPPKPQITFIDKTYDDLWAVFSPDSKYTDIQKEKIFNEEYKGKYAKWTGSVKDIDTTMFKDKIVLYVEHRQKEMFDMGGGDVTAYMNKDQYDKLIEISKDDEVTYTGKFKSFGEFISVSFYLEDGELIS